MQPITPLVAADFHAPVQSMRQKFEVFVDGFWVDMTGYEPVPVPEPPAYNFDLIIQDMAHAHTMENVVWAGEYIYADSPEYDDVVAAIALASPGDTVMVPAGSGSATWTSTPTITRGIIIQGPGEDLLTITTTQDYGLIYEPSAAAFAADDYFRLTGFTFDHSGHASWGRDYGMIWLKGIHYSNALTKNRVDHCKFQGEAGTCIWAGGPLWGVADHCDFVYTSNPYRSYVIPLRGAGGGRNMWDNFPLDADHPFGQGDNFYLESSTFHGGIWFEGGIGGRYGVRHNDFYDHNTGDIFDVHGNQSGDPDNQNYSTMICEIYENTFHDHMAWSRLVVLRGGKNLVYNNALVAKSGYSIAGSYNEAREEFPDGLAPTTNPTPRHITDSYVWGNTLNGSPFAAGDRLYLPSTESTGPSGTPPNQYGYWVDYNGANWTPYTPASPNRRVPLIDLDCWKEEPSFDGSSGIGVGLLSARPSSGLTVGVGYWATDTQTLYRATGATTWETYYTPYTYPHPLRSDPQIGD